MTDIDIPYQFANCTYFKYPHDLKYRDCSISLDMTPCESLKWIHLAKNFRTYFLAIIPFFISIFAIIINLYLVFCLINHWKKCTSDNGNEYASSKKKQLIFLINKTITSIVALITFYIVLLVWKFGSLQYSSASLFIIVGSLSFITLIGFYFATTLLLYLAIVKPVYYRTVVTTRKCYIVVGIIWVAAFSFSILIGILGATLFYHDTSPISCQFKTCQDPIAISLTIFLGILYIFVIFEYIVMLYKMHKYTKKNSKLTEVIQNNSPSFLNKENINDKERKSSSSSMSNNIIAMNRLSINLCIFALSKLPFLILAIVTTVNLYHLSSLGELTKTPCKTFHFGKIYFEVEALASSAAIIWIVGMICDPIIVLSTDKGLKKEHKKYFNYLKCKKFDWKPLPCLINKM
ncbi:G protein-coupled receptor, rhodopsin-like family and GPCR, rhodopsin-like, 7TM domain-containing protein [Strongyloides ratti]|uniref:G protein-coupled receptor, rhodopsin-like family and GPCR, rhodopsin-like, 7TM domain-containing protein n=1 Tax=Strongyloides ratti TaxID=34506 RepID=A0A090LD16_STRRB|nr:G protein-coupled receptor, rhodopsin-like family and GPCR, rhodopsin-like, 7TM domain-containing protein [Strongyloides ratti]CEF65410.1 G protein-coupled receptor, rhodopsin-like family and GPCR, rhodopsin-like, 7TM domain-containing protein [Strongyloides ratti]